MAPGPDSFDHDWLIIGSGFGGSVSALRLAEKGYDVGILECGRRYEDEDFAEATRQLSKYYWMPKIGLKGIFRMTMFKDIFIVSGSGVGGGSLGYANTLYRPAPGSRFYHDDQWVGLGDWESRLAPHYDTAERMLGVTEYAGGEVLADQLLREVGEEMGVGDTWGHTRVGVYFGEEGKTVKDPYFGGEGPDRTGCIKCGSCMVGCRYGAKNTLRKNYLWFAEKLGVKIESERTVTDVRPLGPADGSEGYIVTSERSGAWFRKERRTQTARGVIVAAGALGTNKLLQNCRLGGSLPKISDRLGELVRTNSEAISAVTATSDDYDFANGCAITSSIYPDPDTHIENVTYGRRGDTMGLVFTLLTGEGSGLTRPVKALALIIRHPMNYIRTIFPYHWSRRTMILLTMQSLDNHIRLVPIKQRLGKGHRLQTEEDPLKPNPRFIPAANQATEILARKMNGIAQSALTEALANIPTTAHILGGAAIGADPATGVVDENQRVFGYENLMICDGSVIPANIGVNPSLTITALAEHAMSRLPEKDLVAVAESAAGAA